MKVIPVRDMVIIEPLEEKRESTIIIPDTVNKEPEPRLGKVISLGEGIRTEKGKLVPFEVEVGDMVLFKYFQPRDIKINEGRFFICKEKDILLVIK